MWKVFLILSLGAFRCAVSSSLPRPIRAFFTSVNLRNVLEWTPGNDTPDNATFTVQYTIYGDGVVDGKGRRVNWRAVQRCTEVAQSWCDLSNETSDPEQGYFARVRAVSRKEYSSWVRTERRFDPKSDTSFGPPLVTIKVESNSAIVTVKGPMRYQPFNRMPLVSMETIYPQMMYNLSINNTYRKKTSHFTFSSDLYKHHLIDYNTEYCFSAKAKFLVMLVHCQSSEWQCITTPPDPVVSQLQWAVVGIVVLLLCVCIMVVTGYIFYQYLMGTGQKTPYMLDRAFINQPSLTFPIEKSSLNDIIAISPADTMAGQHFDDLPPQYALHRPPEPVYNGSDRSIYGFLSASSNDCGVRGEGGNNLEHQKNHSSGVYAPQVTVSPLQRSFHTQLQKRTAAAAAAAESSSPEQAALFHSPLNVKGKMLKEDGVTAPGMEEKSQNELEPLLSVYAAHTTKYVSAAHSGQSDFRLADSSGATDLEETEKDGLGHEEEEEEQASGTIFIVWDPKSGKLVLPEFSKDRVDEPGNGGEPTKGGEEEWNVVGGELLLGGVFVRQASDEEVLVPREPGRDPEGGGEVYDILTKWNLVIPMDD